MPRSKAPGPFLRIERIRRKVCKFNPAARRDLLGLLPDRLRQISVTEPIKQKALELRVQQPRTLADLILLDTEKLPTILRRKMQLALNRSLLHKSESRSTSFELHSSHL